MIKKLSIGLLILLNIVNCEQSEPKIAPAEKSNFTNQIVTKAIDFEYQVGDVTIRAPYQWLKETHNPEVLNWLELQNEQTAQYFEAIESDVASLKALAVNVSHTIKHAYKYYYVEKPALNGSISIKEYDTLEENTRLLIEQLPADTLSISQFELDPEGRFIAFEIENTQHRFQWFLYDLANKDYSEHQLKVSLQSTNLIWLTQHRIISIDSNSLSYHNLLKSDVFDHHLFEFKDYIREPAKVNDRNSHDDKQFENSNKSINAFLSFDKQYLLVEILDSITRNSQYWLLDFSQETREFQPLIKSTNSSFQFLGNIDKTFYFKTQLAAPRGRIISINLENPERRYWKEVIAQSSSVLTSAKLIEHKWLLEYRDNTKTRLFYSHLNGTNKQSIAIDSLVKLSYSNKQQAIDPLLVTLESPFNPAMPALLSLEELSISFIEPLARQATDTPWSEVAFYRSDDGSRIPITLIQNAKSLKNESNKTLLLTNQGFAQSYNYSFSVILKEWLDAGNLIAIAHIRGGGTYGKSWHKAASGQYKNKAIDDLKSATEWLYDKHFTSPNKLAILASKHNSPLVASMINSEPTTASAVIFENAYFDLFDNPYRNDQQWRNEFAYFETNKSANQLLKWSPQQNIKAQNYPAILLLGTQLDLSYLANTQSMQTGNNPILLLDLKPEENGDKSLDKTNTEKSLQKILHFLKEQT